MENIRKEMRQTNWREEIGIWDYFSFMEPEMTIFMTSLVPS